VADNQLGGAGGVSQNGVSGPRSALGPGGQQILSQSDASTGIRNAERPVKIDRPKIISTIRNAT
jgi:hypothetical protein